MKKFICITLILFISSLFSYGTRKNCFPVAANAVSLKASFEKNPCLFKQSVLSDNKTSDQSPGKQKKKRIKGSSHEFVTSFENEISFSWPSDQQTFFFYNYSLLSKSQCNSKRGPPLAFT